MCGPCTRLLGVLLVPGPGSAITLVRCPRIGRTTSDGPARNKRVKRPRGGPTERSGSRTPGRRTDRASRCGRASGQDADGAADSTGGVDRRIGRAATGRGAGDQGRAEGDEHDDALEHGGNLQLGCGQGRRRAAAGPPLRAASRGYRQRANAHDRCADAPPCKHLAGRRGLPLRCIRDACTHACANTGRCRAGRHHPAQRSGITHPGGNHRCWPSTTARPWRPRPARRSTRPTPSPTDRSMAILQWTDRRHRRRRGDPPRERPLNGGLRARLFDAEGEDRDFDPREGIPENGHTRLAWVDLDLDAGASLDVVAERLELTDRSVGGSRPTPAEPGLTQGAARLHLTVEALEPDDPDDGRVRLTRREVDLLAVPGMVVSVHHGAVLALDRFTESLADETLLGLLDAGDLLSALVDEVIDGYYHLAEGLDRDIDVLDERALRGRARRRRPRRDRRHPTPHRLHPPDPRAAPHGAVGPGPPGDGDRRRPRSAVARPDRPDRCARSPTSKRCATRCWARTTSTWAASPSGPTT